MARYRKKHRLAVQHYQSKKIYFVTIATANRKAVFLSDKIVNSHLKVLARVSEKWAFDVLAYCYMPDHLHLLIVGKSPISSLPKLIGAYKQATGYQYKQQTGNPIWQKSFYDHILRKEESIFAAARYILNNPVRKQLVEHPADYPYAGSLVYEQAIFDAVSE